VITPERAVALLLENIGVLPSEQAPLSEAAGRVLAEDLTAREDSPAFDNSAMDGYAVRSVDGSSPRRVREVVRAGGRRPEPLATGEAVKIMTGATVPLGADAVVMRELSEILGDGSVQFRRPPTTGENIRRRGEDQNAGAPLLGRGALLRPYEMGCLAYQGFETVPVIRRPRVGILSTGDELVDPSTAPAPGQIRASNGPALAAAVSRWGATVRWTGIAPDAPAKIARAVTEALAESDLLLISGGVSVGDFDHTRAVLGSLGFREIFWKVAIKPGKPLLFGRVGDRPVFGLPGNPVAALVCAEEFVRPALEKMRGHRPSHPPYHLEGILDNGYSKDADRQQYIFCRAQESPAGYRLTVIRPQGSAMMGMACRANALALGPAGVKTLEPGTMVKFRWLK